MAKNQQRKPTTYVRVLKKLTALNNQLPEHQKISYARRRKLIRDEILPYIRTSKSRLSVKEIKQHITRAYRTIPKKPVGACNINYINPAFYSYIPYYELDLKLTRTLPDCIFVKVSAGIYGETRIFNTRNYSYYGSGVRGIIENIRSDFGDSYDEGYFVGIQRLFKGKTNDGTAENYYIEFILHTIQARWVTAHPVKPLGQTVRYLPQGKNKKERKLDKKKRKIVEKRVTKSISETLRKIDNYKTSQKRMFKNIKAKYLELANTTRARIGVHQAKDKKKWKAYLEQKDKYLKYLDKYYQKGRLKKGQFYKQIKKVNESTKKFRKKFN